jgi:hypothetical protein
VELGAVVEAGQRVAEVTDPFSSEKVEIRAPVAGRVLGMALGQVVIPGFALFHIGIEAPPAPDAFVGPSLPVPNGRAEADDDDEALRRELAEERPE